MIRCIAFLLLVLFVNPVMAADCIGVKINPKVEIYKPDWKKTVVQPRTPMNLWHGNVVATLVDNFDIVVDVKPVKDGLCVFLKSVDATIGYNDFTVQIDIRHTPDTCAYRAVLNHEDKHINTYLKVIDDFQNDLRNSVMWAADSVMPVFVNNNDDVNSAIDMINQELQRHPDLILIKQKINAAQEIRNKQVDQQEDGRELEKCFVN
ncbi:MAG: hypothetical protein IKL14_01540 [Alphaproteobacteria bacterium]|nr:hypothetical protein [Alphaproteobacteria bacterium]